MIEIWKGMFVYWTILTVIVVFMGISLSTANFFHRVWKHVNTEAHVIEQPIEQTVYKHVINLPPDNNATINLNGNGTVEFTKEK